ncbi:MAG: molybdopterin-dependent oxidoreductase [Marinobacter sp.]|nr:molybdopterin-dependent oxidoreductase [Marinobacter sp.]
MENLYEPTADVLTTCPYCGVGCGVTTRASGVGGTASHPANQGRLCVKGSALHETIGQTGRLLAPRLRGQTSSWPKALKAVADGIRQAVQDHGADSVAFYLSGQLLTEDYYVANKLAKGFIGTPNVDTNSRLCMSSAVAAHKRAFGEDCVPGCYEDFELADLLVLAGSNAAWAHPVLFQRMEASRRPGRRVVVIDPRRTATAEMADLHLQLKPGTDTILFNGLLVWLADREGIEGDFIEAHCSDYAETLDCARLAAPSVASVANQCDLESADVETFFRWFAETPRTVTGFSQGINQSVAGTDKANAIINCHLATGRVGRPGATPFSLTGQPNAMGGREVGGLANTLASHLDYDTPGARQLLTRFWGAHAIPDGPGLKAVDLFEAVHSGQIKVIWIMGTNPAVSLPDSSRVRDALAKCPLVIVSDCMAETDTTAFADILLPAAGWGEKDGTVTNSERCLSRQRAFLPLPGEVRPDWWIISAVARELGYGTAFDYDGPDDIFREHARLSGRAVGCGPGRRRFDLSALANLSRQEYDALSPVQWPLPGKDMSDTSGTARLFGDGVFATPDGRARMVPVTTILPAQQASEARPLVVNAGRIRDQWHTMTRTALSPRLLAHRPEPFIEVHPDNARACGVRDGELGRLSGPGDHGYVGRIRLTDEVRVGEVFVPIHWNGCFASQALATNLMAGVSDPVSGQPEGKHGTASLAPFNMRWQARLMRRKDPLLPGAGLAACDYWSRQPLAHSHSWWLAGRQPLNWARWAKEWLGGDPNLLLEDPAEGRFRAARVVAGRLEAVLLVDPVIGALPELDWLDQCFAETELSQEQRQCLLAGRAVDTEDSGRLICTCFQVGEKQVEAAISNGERSIDALGQSLQCGTNCGSCIPELRRILDRSGSDAMADDPERSASLA